MAIHFETTHLLANESVNWMNMKFCTHQQPLRVQLVLILTSLLLGYSQLTAAKETIVRLGFLDFEQEASYVARVDNVQESLLAYLRLQAPDIHFEIQYLTSAKLRNAVKNREIDYFLASSGFFVEMFRIGAKDLGTFISKESPNPNACVAGVIITRKPADGKTISISDIKGWRAVSTNPLNFMSHISNLGAIESAGFNPDNFFSKIDFTHDNTEAVLEAVATNQADVGLLRACTFESILSRHPEWVSVFTAVKTPEVDSQPYACARSTALYPGWTFGATPGMSPEITRRITTLLLAIGPQDLISGYTVSIATDYAKVEDLYKRLRLGPYEHLRHWTLKRVWELFWPFILFAVCILTIWFVHWLTLENIVRKRTQELQQANEISNQMKSKLEKLQRIGIVNQLSSIFAHEMAQPMAAMDYWLHAAMVLIKRENTDTKVLTSCLESLKEEQQHASLILKKVRNYAKQDVRRDKVHALDSIVSNVIEEIQRANPHSDCIEVKVRNQTFVCCEEIEIRIVILNLIRNALEAIQSQIKKHILVTVGIYETGEPYFQVINDGQQLSNDAFERLNEPLASLKGNGLGLGIQICKSIAELHAAKMLFERGQNGGLSVTFIFPKRD